MPRALPQPPPEPRHFREGRNENELRVQRCQSRGHGYFTRARSARHAAVATSKSASLAARQRSIATSSTAAPPDIGTGPQSIAVVTLTEGPRMTTNVTGCPQTPEALLLGMPLEVVCKRQTDAIALPVFRPAGSAA